MRCSSALLVKMLILKCCTSIIHSFSTQASSLSDIAALSNAGKLKVLPWPKRSGSEQSIGRLDKFSTNFDVLRVLHDTDAFAPYVGSSGVAVITGGTGGIGVPVSK
jgi:hypothetical protein